MAVTEVKVSPDVLIPLQSNSDCHEEHFLLAFQEGLSCRSHVKCISHVRVFIPASKFILLGVIFFLLAQNDFSRSFKSEDIYTF